jgi:hypothetical protein
VVWLLTIPWNGRSASVECAHKAGRFPKADNPQAFILADAQTRATYEAAYAQTSALYYKIKPTFEQVLREIGRWAARL